MAAPPKVTLCRVALITVVLAAAARTPAGGETAPCAEPGTWIDPATGAPAAAAQVVEAAARRPVVLLGEVHDNADHHRWQLFVLVALHAQRPNLVIGLEMLPRRMQPALDAWVAGRLTAGEFVERSEWHEVWGFDAEIYLPVLHFARLMRVPMVALNVERSLVAKVRDVGWAQVPAGEREGVSRPAPAPAGYVESLARVYAAKQELRQGAAEPRAMPDEATLSAIKSEPAFARFVEAQLTWDRAMAQAIAMARRRADPPTVVALVGRAHAEHGWGVAHQLGDLGIDAVGVLLPTDSACEGLEAGVADAVFVTGKGEKAAPGPRLGVFIETADAGVEVRRVLEGSVAEAAGVESGDVIAVAAGRAIATTRQLIAIVRRQAPGTWLPLTVRRDGAEIDLVAKFPTDVP